VYRGGRWVDPPGGNEKQRGKRPKQQRSEEQPSNKGSETTLPKRGLGACFQRCSHISRIAAWAWLPLRDAASGSYTLRVGSEWAAMRSESRDSSVIQEPAAFPGTEMKSPHESGQPPRVGTTPTLGHLPSHIC
jgi:hypothetical protein